jgi:hypothetical protein
MIEARDARSHRDISRQAPRDSARGLFTIRPALAPVQVQPIE